MYMYHCIFENVKQLECCIEKRQTQNPSIISLLELYDQLEERIKDMKPQDSAYFSKDFILEFTQMKIDRIWNELQEKSQKNEDIIAYRRCREHYNLITIDYDEF